MANGSSTTPRLGGHAVIEQLLALGARQAFCVPGESYLAVMDGAYAHRDRFELTTARQEGGAAMMAVGYAKATGTPGICMVTRGPGATNASIGVHVASQDCAPMILLVGQVPRGQSGRTTFQEVDYRAMFGSLAKAVHQIDDPERLPEFVHRAWHEAASGVPGPVVLAIPEDVTAADCRAAVIDPSPVALAGPTTGDVDRVLDRLAAARKPLLLVGGAPWDRSAVVALAGVADRIGVPVATMVRHQDLLDNDHPRFVGTMGFGTTPGLDERITEADLLVVVGSRIDGLSNPDTSTIAAAVRDERLVHVLPSPEPLHLVHPAAQGIVSAPGPFLTALAERGADRVDASGWQDWSGTLRSAFEGRGQADPDPVRRAYMEVLCKHLPADAMVGAGAGNYTAWYQRHWHFTQHPKQFGTQSGAMGFGVPGVIGALAADPSRLGVAFAGDGCLMMNGQELITAVALDLNLWVVVINNSRLGTIRTHQDRRFPGRAHATDLVNPDFVAHAASFGIPGHRVTSPEELDELLTSVDTTSGRLLVEIQI